MASQVQAVSSLYGGFWNFELQDFCYMTNRYFPPADLIGELASSLPALVKSYPSTNRHLSSLVAAHLGLTQEQVVVGNGATEIISVLSGMCVERLAVPTPTFDEYPNRAAIQGKPFSRFPTDAHFALDVDGFIAHVKEAGANAVVLIRPNNPSGTLISKSSVVDMLQAFRGLDLVVIDESFLYFASPDWPQLSALSLIHEFPNLVIVNSMSKAYGVPGLRLGYAVCGDAALVARLRAELPIWSVNSLAQLFIERLQRYEAEFAESCVLVTRATQALYEGLRTVPFLHPYPTHGNYVLCRTSPELSGAEVTARLFDEHRVLVNDCSGKQGLDHRFFRIASRTTEENEWLAGILRAMAGDEPRALRSAAPDAASR